MSTDDDKAEVIRNLGAVLTPEGIERWFHTQIHTLGTTPIEAIEHGHIDHVLTITRSYLDPSFT